MAIPSTPLPIGTTITGQGSWFGGPNDSSDSGHTASGIPESTPGIAVYNQATLGGYWRVRFPNGRTLDLRQSDLGPAPWTGKKIDVLYSALAPAGYTQGNFPTGGQITATYLGKTPGGAVPALTGPSSPLPAATSTSSGAVTVPGFHASELLYALLFAGALVTGAILLGVGINRAGHGTPGRAPKVSAAA